MGTSILAMIIMLGSLIFVHELGHYLIGRFYGIAVEVFSIGFGPTLFSWKRRGTVYQVCLLPLGGYVKFSGAFPGERKARGVSGSAFGDSSLQARFMTVLAGPAANFLLAVLIYALLAFVGIQRVPAIIGEIMKDSPAEKAGLKSGDKVLSIHDQKIVDWEHMNKIITKSNGVELKLKVLRTSLDGSEEKEIVLTPREVEGEDILGRKILRGQMGVSFGTVPSILTVKSQTQADKAGFKTGMKVVEVSIDDKKYDIQSFAQWKDAYQKFAQSLGENMQTKLKRFDQSELTITISKSNFIPDLEDFGITDGVLTVKKLSDDANINDVPLKFADRLLAFNDIAIQDLYQLQNILTQNKSVDAKLLVLRDGKAVTLQSKLKAVDVQRPEGKSVYYMLPVEFLGAAEIPKLEIERYPYGIDSLYYGFKTTLSQSGLILYTFFELIRGQLPLKSLGGPILIAKVAGDAAKIGWQAFLFAMALISINLAIVNLFPIPALDGGQIVLIVLERLRGKPLSLKSFENYQKIGFIAIMALVVLAFSNDLSRFWADIVKSLSGTGGP